MLPAFKFHLNNQILPRLATIGEYDGKHPCLTCGTNGGKVVIHNPHENDQEGAAAVRYLNINRKITSLCSGKYKEEEGDILLVGTQANLLAYDVEKNKDIFYKDVPDGVNTIAFGRVAPFPEPMAVVGGNCSVQGFDYEGNETFWTVAGDNVNSVVFADATGDGVENLIFGSDDYEIKVLHQEENVYETTETGKIVDLTPIQKNLYGYALQNGTVGVYKGGHRVWRVKSKNKPVSIHAMDLDGDGETEVLIGWDNGKFEVRRNENGQVVYKDMMSSSVAAIQLSDYRKNGTQSILCCTTEGEVRGYVPGAHDGIEPLMEDKVNAEEKVVQQLTKKKAQLSAELKTAEKNVKNMKQDPRETGSVPTSTKILIEAQPNASKRCCDLMIKTNNDSVIKAVVLFDYDSGIFQGGESHVHFPTQPKSSVRIELRPERNVDADLQVKVLVAPRSSSCDCHVFEQKFFLCKFAMFVKIPTPRSKINGCVKFKRPERSQKLETWIQDTFLLDQASLVDTKGDSFSYYFESLRDEKPLGIKLTSSYVLIETPDLTLAAELVQDICSYLQLEELESNADFPAEMERFQQVMTHVDEFNATRLKLTAEMADNSNHVKNLIIRAEDARIVQNMKVMRQTYAELYTLNNQLIEEYTKRSMNHQALLDALKQVNTMIQLASKVRAGNAKSRVIKACRQAIKSNNIHALIYIIQTGQEEAP